MDGLPARGTAARRLGLALPPGPMPLFRGGRPLKRWRYVGLYGPEVMLCAARARVGPLRQESWAIALPDGSLRELTTLRSAGLRLDGSRLEIRCGDVRAALQLEEGEGVEVVSRSGRRGYVWTRKQAGLPVRGTVEIAGRSFEVDGEGAVDETAGYHERHCTWAWSTGVGRGEDGERLAWNLAAGTGVHDHPAASERTLWVDGRPTEVGAVRFAPDLRRISSADGGELAFAGWAAREDRTNTLLVRSSYRQPFGTFSGTLPGGIRLAEGHGIMEEHDVFW